MPPEDVGKNTVTALNTEYDLVYTQNRIADMIWWPANEYQMKAAMKRVHELSQSGKLIHKAALRGGELPTTLLMDAF